MPRTLKKDFRDDDGESLRDRLFEQVEGSLDAYLELFERLAKRAERHGISAVVVLSTSDPLTGYSTHRMGMRGNYYQNLGALERCAARWRAEE